MLERAVTSALSQDFGDLELIISDNASTDPTRELCESFAARDSRVRYLRQPRNRGLHENFKAALTAARGELFMWLCDDDWLDPSYVRKCAARLMADPELSVVGGRCRYHPDRDCSDAITLEQANPSLRVLAFFGQAKEVGIVYGLMRRAQLERVGVPVVVAGADWLLMAGMAFIGKLQTLEDVFIHRSNEGLSQTIEGYVAAVPEVTALGRRFPWEGLVAQVYAEIAWRGSVYQQLGPARRAALATGAAGLMAARQVIWLRAERHLPAIGAVRRHVRRALGHT